MRYSKRKLKPKNFEQFRDAKPPLMRELAEVVCRLGVVSDKEFFECWHLALVIHRSFPNVLHIAELAAGNGLLSWILVLLARTGDTPLLRTAVALDITRSKAAETLASAFKSRWAQLEDAVYFVESSLDSVKAGRGADVLFVANHACGSLSDRALMAAITAGSSIALMPCCHSLRNQTASLKALAAASGLATDMLVSSAESIDQFRADVLLACGYTVHKETISQEITAYNQILIGTLSQPLSTASPTKPRVQEMSNRLNGEIRAYEKIESFDVTSWPDILRLSQTPSREWKRSFDLSIWVESEADEDCLRGILCDLTAPYPFDANTSVIDRFNHPQAQKLSLTFRVDLCSSSVAITKQDAAKLREDIIQFIQFKYALRSSPP